MTIIY